MRVYRTRQSWLPRKLFSLEPGKLVLCICNDQQLACYPSLPYCHLHPPTPQKTGSKKYFKSQAENWKMSCLSVWIFLTQGFNPGLLHCRWSPSQQADSLPTESPRKALHQGSKLITK